jgi:septum formation protein
VPRQLVLASRSPRRIDLLAAAGISADAVPSDAEELVHHPHSPRQLAAENALMKAKVIASARPDAVVLAADTIVVLDGRIFGKPCDMAHAQEMLAELAGRTHEVITAVCILSGSEAARLEFQESTYVRFRPMTSEAIQQYLTTIQPLDKAGAYAAQDDHGILIDRIEGSLTNVIGLPMERTLEALRKHFADVFDDD